MGSLVSIFTVGVNSNHSPGLYTPYKKPAPNFLRRRTTVDDTAQNKPNISHSLSHAGSDELIIDY